MEGYGGYESDKLRLIQKGGSWLVDQGIDKDEVKKCGECHKAAMEGYGGYESDKLRLIQKGGGCDDVCSADLGAKLAEKCGDDDCESEFDGVKTVKDTKAKVDEIGSWLVDQGIDKDEVKKCGECHKAAMEGYGGY